MHRDVGTLANQPDASGTVGSDSTCWRVLDSIGDAGLSAMDTARAASREVVWAQRGEVTGTVLPASSVCGQPLLARDGRRCR